MKLENSSVALALVAVMGMFSLVAFVSYFKTPEESRFDTLGYAGEGITILVDRETSCKYVEYKHMKKNRGGANVTPLLKEDGTPDCEEAMQ